MHAASSRRLTWFPTVSVPSHKGSPDTTSPVRHSAWTEYEGEGSFVTNTTDLASERTIAADEIPKRAGSLSTMKLAELQGMAGSLGLTGTAKMRKGDLVKHFDGRYTKSAVYREVKKMSESGKLSEVVGIVAWVKQE